ncbi:hypothetical protein VPNG_09645 [Cytospora leucostoma]|uniref:Uncharacterized protein n=1 Tax=Cytospora leucostoma TaxID=1230097 RepID=A0A423VMQ9_9PEZI|nr:hypothetical protein VPNG_09645 [Cytospora leucostoma]
MANRTDQWIHMQAQAVNNTGPSNSTYTSQPPGGIGGYVHSYVLIAVAVAILLVLGLCLWPIGKRVRRHYHKKIDRAGDVAVSF